MLASRKPLAIALVFVVLFAMLAPAAMAAPQWAHGVEITSPTTAAPVYVDPTIGTTPPSTDVNGDKWFRVNYTIAVVGDQVDDVLVQTRLLSKVGAPNNAVVTQNAVIQNATLHEGANPRTSDWIAVPPTAAGWYDLVVCVMDADWGRDLFCSTVQVNAVLVDSVYPWVNLDKPAEGAVVSGKDYLLVGQATDSWGINPATPVFQYCAITNWNQPAWPWKCGPQDNSWITVAAGVPTAGVPNQYQATWDSTRVPDDHGVVRFCAADYAGHKICDWNQVFVVNRFTVNLRPGWNLVSTPLMLYDDDMDAVMFHLKANVAGVWTAYNMNAHEPDVYMWKKWVPGDDMKFKAGQGYWINMKAADTLTFVGSFKTTGPSAPPEYPVFEGWNLIGYTHWGQPTSHWIGDKLVSDYLGLPLTPSVEALWRYDAMSETYVPMYFMDYMVKGFGYWLGLAQGGTINP